MPNDPITARNKRLNLVKNIVQKNRRVHRSAIYSALLSSYGVSRKTIDGYIEDLIYMGLVELNDDHLVWKGPEKEKQEVSETS
jgi:hypothetical protein